WKNEWSERVRPLFQQAAKPRIGAAAVIFSIEDEYLPYDLADRDLHVWSVFPIPTDPFCIRSGDDFDAASCRWPLVKEIIAADRAVEIEVVATEEPADEAAPSDLAVLGSPDCVLDDWVWKTQQFVQHDRLLKRWTNPGHYGHQLAALLLGGKDWTLQAVQHLAKVLPESAPQPPKRPTAGDQLLVRAGAVKSREPIAETATESNPAAAVANLPGGCVLR
ncbi:MAG: hypothetical protein MI861_24005, partial [Pirellulales bacterium]|nr:hypothetical protein [Pirellulales bacterium]